MHDVDAAAGPTGPLEIEIWSDVVCPWCAIGKHRFESALAAIGDAVEVTVTYRAYQLDPTASPGRAEPVIDAYARKFGGPDKARAIIDHVTGVAAGDGITFDMDRAVRANTLLAHRLIWRAGLPDSPVTQSAVKGALLAAYFTDGRDIGDPDHLAEVLAPLGLDPAETVAFLDGDLGRAEVADEISRAAELGISAVPTYVIGGRWSIPGAQDADTFERVLRRLAERPA
jgi:predicted DsbA family dithiol-disulfide isomerase